MLVHLPTQFEFCRNRLFIFTNSMLLLYINILDSESREEFIDLAMTIPKTKLMGDGKSKKCWLPMSKMPIEWRLKIFIPKSEVLTHHTDTILYFKFKFHKPLFSISLTTIYVITNYIDYNIYIIKLLIIIILH